MKIERILKVIIICTFFLNISSAMGISPAKLVLELEEMEEGCDFIWVSQMEDLIVESRWSKKRKDVIRGYTLSPESIGISIETFNLGGGKYEICLKASKKGDYFGAILFQDPRKPLKIGTWIDLNVYGIDPSGKITLLTGNVAKDIREKSSELKNEILAGSLIFLIGFLGVLIFVKRK